MSPAASSQPAGFEADAVRAVARVRDAFARIIETKCAGSKSVTSLCEAFGVHRKLAWQIAKVAYESDPFVAARHMPNAKGVESWLDAAATKGVPVDLVPAGLSAMETKWLIARLAAFAGARTHATIAAFSTCVPTLSLSYSVKAQGLNEDLFGHTEFCRPVSGLTPDAFVAGVTRLLDEGEAIRAHLEAEVPGAKARAMAAGERLKEIVAARR